jgi:DNA-binding GntR family transcriptional regulator
MARDVSARPSRSPRRLVLSDGTYDAIKSLILEHEISPGEHMSIDQLARDLSVSQTPVREALARLEADGLVTKIPLRGYEATDLLSVQQFDDLFQFRGLIEPWAAGEAARRSTRREGDALDAELAKAQNIPRSGVSIAYPEFIEHDTRFHSIVARASGNFFIEDAFVRTHCHMHLFRVYRATMTIQESAEAIGGEFVQDLFAEYYRGKDRPLALSEHEQIATAIKGGDSGGAHELMLNHIESSRQRFAPAVEALNAMTV